MAIQNADQLVAALGTGQTISYTKRFQGVTTLTNGDLYSGWHFPGRPAAGNAPAGGNQEVHYSAGGGAPLFTNPTGGKTSYLGRFGAASSCPGAVILGDRLWSGGVVGNVLATTNFANPFLNTLPSNTLRLDPGEGAELWIENYLAVTAGTGSLTITYLNQNGVVRTTTYVPPTAANRQYKSDLVPLSTAGGIIDTGVRAVQSVQVTATTGSALVVFSMFRRLVEVGCPAAGTGFTLDAEGTGMPPIKDNAALAAYFMYGDISGGAIPVLNGSARIIQG